MNEIRLDRLEMVAAHLDKMERKNFYFGAVKMNKPSCGTTCCAMGETPNIFPDLGIRYMVQSLINSKTKYFEIIRYDTEGKLIANGYGEVAAQIFNINEAIAIALFSPERYILGVTKPLRDSARPKQVADNIRAFIKSIQGGAIIQEYMVRDIDDEDYDDQD
jgi:hypothetical protein